MRRAFIIAPNIGLSFGGGGGVKVALYMAQTLLEHGLKVHLVALSGWHIAELDRAHGTNLRRFHREEKVVLNYLFGSGESLRIPFPITISLIALYVRRLVREHLPDLLIFHDDVPRLGEEVFKNVSKIMLYSHFPYVARTRFNIVDAVEVGLEKYQSYKTRLYYVALKRVVYYDNMPKEVELVANSTVTKAFMELLWRRNVKVLYPPITFQLKPLEKLKNNSVILVGGQPNKRIGDAIKALAELRNRSRLTPKLYVVAYHFVPWYREWLLNLVHRLGLQQYVHFMEKLPERDLLNLYASSKIILSTAHFEPFGMSVAEGMALRAVPVVYKGSLSGPWIDVVDKGRYGIGFRTTEELAEAIEHVINTEGELSELQDKAFERSRIFLLSTFKKKFQGLIESII
jgi:glycosyltransferase involved in cell wall biosynthesis